jgi:hypothetical protein
MEVRSHTFSDIDIKQMTTVTVYSLMASNGNQVIEGQ